jgi:hypothetical protein
MIGDIKKSILHGIYQPLALATVARKGFAQTLVDTGAMSESVEYEVIVEGNTVEHAYSAKKPEPEGGRKRNKKKWGI